MAEAVAGTVGASDIKWMTQTPQRKGQARRSPRLDCG